MNHESTKPLGSKKMLCLYNKLLVNFFDVIVYLRREVTKF